VGGNPFPPSPTLMAGPQASHQLNPALVVHITFIKWYPLEYKCRVVGKIVSSLTETVMLFTLGTREGGADVADVGCYEYR